MKSKCIEAVNKAVGRELSGAEIKAIEDRLIRHMKQNAVNNPDWMTLSRDQRATTAAQTALAEFRAEKAKELQQKNLAVIKQARSVTRMAKLKESGKHKYMAGALGNLLEQVDVYQKGVTRQNFSALMDTMNAADPRFFGLMENPQAVRDFVFEVFGKKSGNEVAAKGAKAWLDQIEKMRVRFNNAGGAVRKLDYGYIPQPHDAARVLKAGEDTWVNNIMPLLDRNRYRREDGSRMTDDEIRLMLRSAYSTISTGGLNKIEPGKFMGSGKTANHGSDARQIHFKGPEEYLQYMKDYGRGSVFDAMQRHIGGMSRDIALVEELGPNPAQTYRLLHDTAKKADGGDEKMFGPLLVTAKNMWDSMSGVTSQAAHARFAEINQDIRNYTVAAKLQGTILSSTTDLATMMSTASYNNISKIELLKNVIKSFGKDYKDYANNMGMVADSVISDMNRWAEGNIGQNWSSKLANTTMKVSLMNAWTDALRRGFSISMMNAFAKMAKTDWAKLNKNDRRRLEEKGVTERDWDVLRLVKSDDWKGSEMLTPEAIDKIPDAALEKFGDPFSVKEKVKSRLLGFIADESEYAVLAPDLMTRAAVQRGTQKGTVGGELLRHTMLFKSFPFAMISRHLRRIANIESTAGKLSYGVSLAIGLTTMGALSLTLKDLVAGKDPRDMTEKKFWGAAFIQGGGLGIYGDLLYTGMGGNSRGGQANWANIAGPVVGTGFDLANITLGNAGELMQGKDTNIGAEAIRFSRQNMPFVNLWYARSALDHMFIHEMQEAASPGYLSKMRSNTRKEWGQNYWWEPGTGLPDRAPDLSAAVGE